MNNYIRLNVESMVGKTFVSVTANTEEIQFHMADGSYFSMHHVQDCCESVEVEDISGDVNDLVGTPILVAEERSSEDKSGEYESATWTFYCLRTIKGSVDIRWLGTSNGYYSEGVDVLLVAPR